MPAQEEKAKRRVWRGGGGGGGGAVKWNTDQRSYRTYRHRHNTFTAYIVLLLHIDRYSNRIDGIDERVSTHHTTMHTDRNETCNVTQRNASLYAYAHIAVEFGRESDYPRLREPFVDRFAPLLQSAMRPVHLSFFLSFFLFCSFFSDEMYY